MSRPIISDVFRACAEKSWVNDTAWNLSTHEGKAEATARILDRVNVKDSLLLCDSCCDDSGKRLIVLSRGILQWSY